MLSVTELHPTHVTTEDMESWDPSKALLSDSPIHVPLGLIACGGGTSAECSQVCPRDEKTNRKQLQGCFQGSLVLNRLVARWRAVPEPAGDSVQLGLSCVLPLQGDKER